MSIQDEIIALERVALDQWASGDAAAYVVNGAEDVSYIDNLGAKDPVFGKDSVKEYASTMYHDLTEHKYEILDPKVRDLGDSAIMTYRYQPFSEEGQPSTKWSATVVYSKVEGTWKMVHSHWTLLIPIPGLDQEN